MIDAELQGSNLQGSGAAAPGKNKQRGVGGGATPPKNHILEQCFGTIRIFKFEKLNFRPKPSMEDMRAACRDRHCYLRRFRKPLLVLQNS